MLYYGVDKQSRLGHIKFEWWGFVDELAAKHEMSEEDIKLRFIEPAISILTIISLRNFLEKELAKLVDVIHAPLPEGSIVEIGRTVSIL